MTPQEATRKESQGNIAVTYAKIRKQLSFKVFGFHVCVFVLSQLGHIHLATVRYCYDEYIKSGERTLSNQTNPTHTRIVKSSDVSLFISIQHIFISWTRQSENLHCGRPPINLSRSYIKYFECLARHVGGVELLLH